MIMNGEREFPAFVVHQESDGTFLGRTETRRIDDLPDGEITVRVSHSSLNYKDALSATGNRGVTRDYPHQPGIDAVGVVEESSHSRFRRGDAVIVDGGDLGMNTPGGFGGYIRVPAAWAVSLPPSLSPRNAMALGTAGFTAALAAGEVTSIVGPEDGEILVTGATGGVGSYAVSILSHLGYSVCAVTGKADAVDYLKGLGAGRTISRTEAADRWEKPLLSAEWAGVIDTVGGPILSRAIKACHHGGAVAACGNAASPELSLTVFPFILRGVRLIGIDSTTCPVEQREQIWNRLATDWWPRGVDEIVRDITLEELNDEIQRMLHGDMRGRVVVHIPDFDGD
jgi:acrylyl-CoA reductase (NADPH)